MHDLRYRWRLDCRGLYHADDATVGPIMNGLQTVHVRDVGMIERGQRLGFALESFAVRGIVRQCKRQNFDGHLPSQRRIGGSVDFPHSTGPES